MWLGLLEDNNMLFCRYIRKHCGCPFAFINAKHFSLCRFFICAAKNSVQISVRTSCTKACIGFALKPAEPLNDFLRALLEIPLTPRQGVDLSFW